MTHWIASSTRDNWKILDKKHIWGVPKRNRTLMHRVKPGDTILVYVRQEKGDDTIHWRQVNFERGVSPIALATIIP